MAAQTQETITVAVVYEDGMFRPLEPLDLPEHTQGNVILKVAQNTTDLSDEEFDALFAAGLPFVKMPTDGLHPMSEEAQEKLRREIGPGVDLSGAILEERETQL